MNKIYILSFIFLLPILAMGQTKNNYTRDTILINSYIDSISKYIFSDKDEALLYINKVDSLSKINKYNLGLYKSNNYRGIFYYILDDYNKSIEYYKKSLDYCEKDDTKKRAKIYTNISYSYNVLTKYDSSIFYLDKVNSLKNIEENTDIYLRAIFGKASIRIQQNDYIRALPYIEEGENILQNTTPESGFYGYYSIIGNFYRNVDDFDNAFKAYKTSIKYQNDFDIKVNQWKTYFSIAFLYMRIKENYDSALYYAYKGINENEIEFSSFDSLKLNLQLGNIFFEKGDVDSSSYYYMKAYNNKSSQKFKDYKAAIITNLGMYYGRKNNTEKAKEFLLLGLEISKKQGLLKFQKNALIELASIEENNKNFPLAYKYYKEYNTIIDSLKIEETKQRNSEMEYKNFLIKRKYQNELLTERLAGQDKKILVQRVGIVVFLGFLAILIFVLIYINRSKKKISSLNERLNESIADLKELSHFKENMTNMIVHDLKNPLGSIINVEYIEDKVVRDAIVKQSAFRMLNLVENILNVYKYTDSKIELNRKEIMLSVVLEKALNEVSFLVDKSSIKIKSSHNLNCILNIDEDIIRRVFVNLLTNAIKFSPIKGTIDIGTKLEKNNILISVTNSGESIAKQDQELIFKPFGQVSKKRSGKIKSTGLGLAFCKLAVESHNGEIGVISEEDSKTSFWFKLPDSVVSKTEIHIAKKQEYTLSQDDKLYLRVFVNKLLQIEIYEVSSINKLLLEIENISEAVKIWKEKVKTAVSFSNNDSYQKLINIDSI